jgi:hypothetical protein
MCCYGADVITDSCIDGKDGMMDDGWMTDPDMENGISKTITGITTERLLALPLSLPPNGQYIVKQDETENRPTYQRD